MRGTKKYGRATRGRLGDGVEVDRRRTNARERGRNNQRSYVRWVCEYVIAGVPPGLRESEPEYPRPLHLPLSSSPLLLPSCSPRSYACIANADARSKLFLRTTRGSANFSRGHPSSEFIAFDSPSNSNGNDLFLERDFEEYQVSIVLYIFYGALLRFIL